MQLDSFFSFLLLLHLCMQVDRQKVSGVAESTGPTADGPLSRMCCSFPMLESDLWYEGMILEGCGLCAWSGGQLEIDGQLGKIYSRSRDLVVILFSLGALSAKEVCSVLSFSV